MDLRVCMFAHTFSEDVRGTIQRDVGKVER